MSKPIDQRRRFFFKTLSVTVGSLVVAPLTKLMAATAPTPPPAKDVDEKDPLATALGYKKNPATVDPKKFPKHATADGKTQFCKTCMFYTPAGAAKGKCQIFSGNYVVPGGWCNSWTKKAG